MSEGGFAARAVTAAAPIAAPDAAPAPKAPSPLPRLRSAIVDLGNAILAKTPAIPALGVSVQQALDAAVNARKWLSEVDRKALPDLELRARALMTLAKQPRYVVFDLFDPTNYEIDWDVVSKIVNEVLPGSGPVVKAMPRSVMDATESLVRAPFFMNQVFEEQWEDFKEHWYEYLNTAATMVALEVTVGILAAAPDPTMATKIGAIALQALLIVLAIHAAIQLGSEVIAYATAWWSNVKAANGDQKMIDAAALSFARLLYALLQAVAATLAGRAIGKLRAGKPSTGKLGSGEPELAPGKKPRAVGAAEPNETTKSPRKPATAEKEPQQISEPERSHEAKGDDGKSAGSAGSLPREVVHNVEVLGNEHKLKLVTNADGSARLHLCSTCTEVRLELEEIIKSTPAKGPSKTVRVRLERLHKRVAELEARVEERSISHVAALGELETIGNDIKNLGTKVPGKDPQCVLCGFKAEIDYDLLAKQLGYDKLSIFSHGEPVYRRGADYITPDVDRHNGGIWKRADSPRKLGTRGMRKGTYNEDLTERIGP